MGARESASWQNASFRLGSKDELPVELLLRLSKEWCNFAMDNGHSRAEEVGHPKQREELPAEEHD